MSRDRDILIEAIARQADLFPKAEPTGLHRVWLDHPVFGRETVGEYLARHKIPVVNGKVTLHHAMPKDSTHTELRAGSYLESDPAAARHFAARDRGLDPERDIKVHTLELSPDDIQPGVHITLRNPKSLLKESTQPQLKFMSPEAYKRNLTGKTIAQLRAIMKDAAQAAEFQPANAGFFYDEIGYAAEEISRRKLPNQRGKK